MDEIIEDSEFLKNLDNYDQIYIEEEIGFSLDIIILLYKGYTDYTPEDYLEIIEKLHFLISEKLLEILIFINFNANLKSFLLEKLNNDILKDFFEIDFEDTLEKTLLKYGFFKSIYLNIENYPEIFRFVCSNPIKNQYETIRFLHKNFNFDCHYDDILNFINHCDSKSLDYLVKNGYNTLFLEYLETLLLGNRFINYFLPTEDNSKYIINYLIENKMEKISSFLKIAIQKLSLGVLKYFIEKIGDFSVTERDFRRSFENPNKGVTEFLYNSGKFELPEIHIFIENLIGGNYYFCKWRFSFGDISLSLMESHFNQKIFRKDLKFIKWMHKINGDLIENLSIDYSKIKNDVFIWIVENYDCLMFNFLTLPFEFENIDKYIISIKHGKIKLKTIFNMFKSKDVIDYKHLKISFIILSKSLSEYHDFFVGIKQKIKILEKIKNSDKILDFLKGFVS